jgi:bifunctional UDP-N-acetylglucosamine pyrophosphorylase/glucosamine-1-phosphate N-acetyltransferase
MSQSKKLSAVVLAAGQSKRFKGKGAKVLHPVCGRPILGHVLETLRDVHRKARLHTVCLVVPPGKLVEKAIDVSGYPFEVVFATQRRPRGTGDAVATGLKALGRTDEVLVLAGDAPLVRAPSLVSLVQKRRKTKAAGAILTAVLTDGGPYGRVLRNATKITGVVEARDATPEQRAIREINTCTYVFSRKTLERVLPRLRADNAQREIYFTDVVGETVAAGESLIGSEGDPDEVLGTNTRAELATVTRLMRERILDDLMDRGITVVDPGTTYVDAGVVCGADTVLLPNTFLEGTTTIGTGCEIGPNVRLVDTRVDDNATVTFAVAVQARIGREARVGPFASLRPGTVLGPRAEMGSFGEMKNAKIGEGVKVHHFSYLGDVNVGRGTNIGAGVITSNYDGRNKHATTIGPEAFIGSDSILVAPVRVGRGAYTGSGSVVTHDVRAGEVVYGVPARPQRKAAKPKVQAKKKPVRKRSSRRTVEKKGVRGSSSAKALRSPGQRGGR